MSVQKVVAIAMLAATSAAFTAIAGAQQSQSNFGISLSGGQGGGGMLFSMPGSSPAQLLKRIDFQAGINLTNGQRSQLEGVINAGPKPISVNINRSSTDGNPPPKPDGDEIRKQIEEQIQKGKDEQDNQLKAVLKPEQLQRLHELWLQWKGPLSLSDYKIAEEMKIASTTRDKIAPIVKEFDTLRDQIMRKHMQVVDNSSPDGSQRRVMMKADFKDTLHNIFHLDRKAIEKAKKEAEDKVMALLTAEEISRYKEAQGKPNQFRLDETANWQRVFH